MPSWGSQPGRTTCPPAIVQDAARVGIHVGSLLLASGGGSLWAAQADGAGEALLALPSPTSTQQAKPDALPVGYGPCAIELPHPTSAFILRGLRTTGETSELLFRVIDRQRVDGGPPLARLLATPALGGQPAALYERPPGNPLRSLLHGHPAEARRAMSAAARALVTLHERFGFHGDLTPDHMIVAEGGADVALLAPLDSRLSSCEVSGTIGYVLPLRPWRGGPDLRDEMLLLRDVGALAVMVAEAWGGDLGWDARLATLFANQGRGRFGDPLDSRGFAEQSRRGLEPVPWPIRTWVEEVCERIAEVAIVAPMRPAMMARLASGNLPERGTARAHLWRLAALDVAPDAFDPRRLQLLRQSVEGMFLHLNDDGGAGPVGLLIAAEQAHDVTARERLLRQPYLRAEPQDGFARYWRFALDLEWLLAQYVGPLPRVPAATPAGAPRLGPSGTELRSFVHGVLAYVNLVQGLAAAAADQTARRAGALAAALRRARAALLEEGALTEAVREYSAFLRLP